MIEIDCYDLHECPGTCDDECRVLTETCCVRFSCGDGQHALNCPKRKRDNAPGATRGDGGTSNG